MADNIGPDVAKVLAKLQASADAARARQAAAAEAARANIAAKGGRAALARDIDTGAELPDVLDIAKPESTSGYDFEKFPSEVDVHSSHSGPAPEGSPAHLEGKAAQMLAEEPSGIFEAPSEPSSSLKAKAASRAHPAPEMNTPAKSIEQLALEDAERQLGRKPLMPPETGGMEGQAVKSIIDRRGANLGRVAGDRRGVAEVPELSDSQVQGLVDEVQGGKILTNAEDAAQLQSVTPKTSTVPDAAGAGIEDDLLKMSDDAFKGLVQDTIDAPVKGTIKRSIPNAATRLAPRLAAQVARESYQAPSLASKVAGRVGRAAGQASKFIAEHPKTAGSLVNAVTSPFKELASPLEGFSKAGAMGKGWKVVKVGGQGLKMAGRDLIAPYALEKIGEGGLESAFENLGATDRGVEMPGTTDDFFTGEKGFSSLLDASNDAKVNLANYNASANKYGLKVTGRTGMGSIYGLPLLNRFVQPGADIQVQEDPTLMAAYKARNKARIQEMMEQWAQKPE